jgi:hypothetical protein
MKELIFLIAYFLALGTVGFSIGYLISNNSCQSKEATNFNCDCKYDCPGCSISNLQMIAEDNAKEHLYKDGYMCKEYSEQLEQRLLDSGYNATTCLGYALWCNSTNDKNCFHEWVRVDGIMIESTIGTILSPQEFKEGYNTSECGSGS